MSNSMHVSIVCCGTEGLEQHLCDPICGEYNLEQCPLQEDFGCVMLCYALVVLCCVLLFYVTRGFPALKLCAFNLVITHSQTHFLET